jgi:hypothetical protein
MKDLWIIFDRAFYNKFARIFVRCGTTGQEKPLEPFVILSEAKNLSFFSRSQNRREIPRFAQNVKTKPFISGQSCRDSSASVLPCAHKNKKSLARNTRRNAPHPFSRSVPATTAWEGVLTYGNIADHSGGTVADSHGLPPLPKPANCRFEVYVVLRQVSTMAIRK